MRAVHLVTLVLLSAGIAAGLFLDRSWLSIAFIGLMLFMHTFGHGSHGGGSTDSHADSEHGDGNHHQASIR